MTTQTTATLKTAGTNILMQLVAYLLQKAADKTTTFAGTQTAIKSVALTAVQDLAVAKLATLAITETATVDTPVAQ